MPNKPNKQALDGAYETFRYLFSKLEDDVLPPREKFDAAYADRLEDWFSTEDGQAFEAWTTNKTDQISDEVLQRAHQFLKDAHSQPSADQGPPENTEDLHQYPVKALDKLNKHVSTGPFDLNEASLRGNYLNAAYAKYTVLFSGLNDDVLPSRTEFTDQDAKRIKKWLGTHYGEIFLSWAIGFRRYLSNLEFDTIDRNLRCIKERSDPLSYQHVFPDPYISGIRNILPYSALEVKLFVPNDMDDKDLSPDYFKSPLMQLSKNKTPSENKPALSRKAQRRQRSNTISPPPKASFNMPPSFKKLDGMIGLETVKHEIRTKVAVARVQKEREKQGLPKDENTLHMIFTGNPGTGKTAVARIVGKIYAEAGLLEKGQLVEMDRSDLTGEFQGDIERNTKAKLAKAEGGVFFLDEAYDLAPRKDGRHDIGSLAITIILRAMYNQRDSFAVIAAGYSDKMSDFLDSNPGLRSRFPTIIEFPDYSPDELSAIFTKMAKDAEYRLSKPTTQKINQVVRTLYNNRDKNFGNAREIETLFEKCRARLSLRVSEISKPNLNDLMNILPEDVPDSDELN